MKYINTWKMPNFYYCLALQYFILSLFGISATYKMRIVVKTHDVFSILPSGLACFSGLPLQGLFKIMQFL